MSFIIADRKCIGTFLSKKWYHRNYFFKQDYLWELHSMELFSAELRSTELHKNSNLHSPNTISSRKKMVKKGYYGNESLDLA